MTHPSVVSVYDIPDVPAGEVPVMVLEYLQGQDLSQYLERHGAVPLAKALAWIFQVAEGLTAAHQVGVLHRDIKPANLMLAEGRIRILDLGLACIEGGTQLTMSGMTMGSLPYMPPEQFEGSQVTEAADQFSLAATAFELLSGALPFDPSDRARKNPFRLLETNPNLPATLDPVLQKALAPAPQDRFGSIREFQSALEDLHRT